MSKQEALEISAKEGKRITHHRFEPDEWMQVLPSGNYRLEDRVECTPAHFWKWRNTADWQDGWQLFE